MSNAIKGQEGELNRPLLEVAHSDHSQSNREGLVAAEVWFVVNYKPHSLRLNREGVGDPKSAGGHRGHVILWEAQLWKKRLGTGEEESELNNKGFNFFSLQKGFSDLRTFICFRREASLGRTWKDARVLMYSLITQSSNHTLRDLPN